MSDFVDVLAIRKRLGRDEWKAPEFMADRMPLHAGMPGAQDGWMIDQRHGDGRIILGAHVEQEDGAVWLHASISRSTMPSYQDLTMLHAAVWDGDGFSYQVFVPETEHVNIHPRTLHLWGRADGTRVLPNFGRLGSI